MICVSLPLENNRPFTDSYPFDTGPNGEIQRANGRTEKANKRDREGAKSRLTWSRKDSRGVNCKVPPENADIAHSRVACQSF